jgi:hypothetical protein
MVEGCLESTTAQYSVTPISIDPVNAPGMATIEPASSIFSGGARGKLKMKRCKNGSHRNAKTKKCVKKLNAKAKTFSMKKKLNAKAKTFSMKKKLNAKAKTFSMKKKSSNSCSKYKKKSTASNINSFLKGIKSKTKSKSKSSSSKCKLSTEKKYLNRPSPPMSATTCALGVVKVGNDGKKWQIVKTKKSKRWARCNQKNTKC